MFSLCKQDKNKVKEQIQNQILDGIVASNSSLIDDIILSMSHEGIFDCLSNGFPDKRHHNTIVPMNLIMALAIAAKMKTRTSLTDIPYAIRDHRALAELGYNALNSSDDGWMNEGTIRHLIGKYDANDMFAYYNDVVQNHIFKALNICPDIHILDCTKIAVEFYNSNYEGSTIAIDRKGNKMRGYKIASLRGLHGDSGIIEEMRFGTAATHDLALSEEMLKTSPCLREGDILIMDRGFISRALIKYLKEVRKIDTYIPMKKGMAEYEMAITLVEEIDNWKPHPSRKDQMVCHVPKVYMAWRSTSLCENVKENIDFNACVVWTQGVDGYFVFTTTDMSKTAEEIIMMYEMRPEIEEDFRQLKEFWELEDFKSTKLNVIAFHLICVLFGYLFYQLYLNTEDGEKYIGKCLPVILKNYKEEFLQYLVLYSGEYFCSMTMREFIEYRDGCDDVIKRFILEFFA
ncbi:transposase [Amedibacillus sp. YH-ame10]